MRIILFMDNPQAPTGYASTCRLTAKELMKRGHEVLAMAFNGGPPYEGMAEWYGIPVVANDAVKRDKNAIYGDQQLVMDLDAYFKPDVFFLHNDCYRYAYVGGLPPEVLKKFVFWLPFEGEKRDDLGVALFSKFGATRFVTKYAMGLHEGGLLDKDIGHIPHAIDIENYTPCKDKKLAKAAKELGLENKFVVTRVDRHQPRKYWDRSLRAFAKFASGKPDVFMLCKCDPRDVTMWDHAKGEGTDLEVLAAELGIKDKVFFDDYFFNPPAMAAAFMHPADVFLTTTSGEGFGLTAAEAMSCGVPVICPDTPVLPEVVGMGGRFCKIASKEYYTPMHVHHNLVDVDDVASKLEWAYSDWKAGGKQLQEIGERGRKITEEKYSPQVVYDAWDAVLATVGLRKGLATLVTVLYNTAGDAQINGDDGVARLKESLEKYVQSPYEWIIVDNGSPKRELTRKWMEAAAKSNPRIRLKYLDENMGYAGGNNAGIAMAKGEYVILLNPDSEALDAGKLGLPGDFVSMMVAKARSDDGIGVVGMEISRRDDVLSGSMFPYFCNVLITKQCLDATRLADDKWLDEAFWPAYYEDADFCMRAMGKGFKLVEENVPFWHKSGGTNKFAIEGGSGGEHAKSLHATAEALAVLSPGMADFQRKKGELLSGGMQGVISGNIAYLNHKWGAQARSKVKVLWETHIGASVGFSQIAEGLIPELHALGFDVYVNDWAGGANTTDPLIRSLIEKTRKAKEVGGLDDAISIVCWLMETFLNVEASYKVGVSFCESTRVRPSYLNACNGMDRILTFSEFCRGVQKNSGYTSPIHVIPPGVNPAYMEKHSRPRSGKFTFLTVGVSQDRKDTFRLVESFCSLFPKNQAFPPGVGPGFPLKCSDVELVVKSNVFGDLAWIKENGFDKKANVRGIYTGGAERAERPDLTVEEMRDLYFSADCLVQPSHGEGIGMPLLEGAATGLPVIFTKWSSPVEYLGEGNAYPIRLDPRKPMSPAYVGHGCEPGENGEWANASMDHMKQLMLEVIKNREAGQRKGEAAHDVVKKKFTWKESARYLMPLLFEWDDERKKKQASGEFDPVTFKKPDMEPIKQGDRVLIDVVTRDRRSYLATLLVSLLSQSFKDWDIIVQIDDTDESVLGDHQIMSLMNRMGDEGHNWRIIRSHRQGPHIAHDRTLQMAADCPTHKYKLVCRVDDDIYLRPDYLEKLFGTFLGDDKCSIGAVGGTYPFPNRPKSEQTAPKGFEDNVDYAGKISHNVPWPYICFYPDGTPPREVEHLYSSFMYRVEVAKAIGGYCRQYSQIGHREESDFSYRFHLAGFRLLIQPAAVGLHFAAPSGGIRSSSIIDKEALSHSDHKIYERRLAKWHKRLAEGAPSKPRPKVAVVINCGSDVGLIKQAVERFSKMADSIYVTAPISDPSIAGDKVKFVSTSGDDSAMLATALLTEGDHEFIMTVTDTTMFWADPLPLLSDKHDDYVFEVYKSYLGGPEKRLLGPEVRNECLITRRNRRHQQPTLARTLYADIVVVDDVGMPPLKDKSIYGNHLLSPSDLDSVEWRKICTYQFPEGDLKPPRYLDVAPTEFNGVSIIIPTAGRLMLLKKCLGSIYSLTTTPFEVIVVDNGSSDGTAEYLAEECKKKPRLRVLTQPMNLGYQRAVNIGVDAARGKYILLFNDDAWVEAAEPDGRDWLKVYVDELDRDPKLGLVGPHGGRSPALGKDILFFWCVMTRKGTWQEIGRLDDVTFRNYGGDDDYCERARAKGYKIKVKLTKLRHLMTCVPEHEKKPELETSRIKLKQKYPS